MKNTLQIENQLLRKQLQTLLDEARLNEKKWRRLDAVEKQLIATRSLSELFRVILNDYKTACDTDVVTLALLDPEYEITRILESEQQGNSRMPGLVLLANGCGNCGKPYLGALDVESTKAIFDPWPAGCLSMALLPLLRQGEPIGSLNLASRKAERFTPDSGTDFLERLAAVFSICLENSLNHERLKLVGLTDPLTGAYNRRYFETRCQEEAAHAQRHDQPLSCMFLDIDNFKRINDSLGHLAGDEVLRNVAQLIKLQLRRHDVLARYGGEEFVALLPKTGLHQAAEIAERIRTALAAQPMQPLPGESLNATISIGVAALPHEFAVDDYEAIKHMVAAADAALYRAKEGGRNRVVCAAPQHTAADFTFEPA